MSEQSQYSFILASVSPRRKQLLAEAGYKFTVVRPDIDESAFPVEGIKACEYAKRLALAKAKDVAQKHPDSLVIGADTVVDFEEQIIGKPTDAKEAEQITKKLFSKPHKVITGIAIVRLSDGIELSQSDTTTVYPKRLTSEQIAEHIKSKTWRDKAGAYAIKENGDEFIERIEGSLTNVMGLPMELLKRLLTGIPRAGASPEK
ncbi:MAG TPA: nucleoside triphosphate pyrophosphatase [Sedimentisphaerales bacterium]|nr:nucleoside triphosphate pyrophosphatase [Sedimentisphaerales bacterium]